MNLTKIFTDAWNTTIKRPQIVLPVVLSFLFAILLMLPALYFSGSYDLLYDFVDMKTDFDESYLEIYPGDELDFMIDGPIYNQRLDAHLESTDFESRFMLLLNLPNVVLFVLIGLLMFILSMYLNTSFYLMVSDAVSRHKPDFLSSLREAKSYFLYILGFSIVRFLLFVLAAVVLIPLILISTLSIFGLVLIPFLVLVLIALLIWFGMGFLFGPVLIVKKDYGVFDAVKEGFSLAYQNKLNVFLLFIILSIISNFASSLGAQPAWQAMSYILFPIAPHLFIFNAILLILFIFISAFISAFRMSVIFCAFKEV